MSDSQSDSGKNELEGFSDEELRLADLFDKADRLSQDEGALDRFLDTLNEQDRREVSSVLACANALRLASQEDPPALTGAAWDRITDRIHSVPNDSDEVWSEIEEEALRFARQRRGD